MTSFQVESDEQFVELLQSQGSKLIVIDFFATWSVSVSLEAYLTLALLGAGHVKGSSQP